MPLPVLFLWMMITNLFGILILGTFILFCIITTMKIIRARTSRILWRSYLIYFVTTATIFFRFIGGKIFVALAQGQIKAGAVDPHDFYENYFSGGFYVYLLVTIFLAINLIHKRKVVEYAFSVFSVACFVWFAYLEYDFWLDPLKGMK